MEYGVKRVTCKADKVKKNKQTGEWKMKVEDGNICMPLGGCEYVCRWK